MNSNHSHCKHTIASFRNCPQHDAAHLRFNEGFMRNLIFTLRILNYVIN